MRVLLHSGGPLGPVGRAALAEFVGPRRRIAFVTAASLHDETVYFERIRPQPSRRRSCAMDFTT
jgi:hypothetical protein